MKKLLLAGFFMLFATLGFSQGIEDHGKTYYDTEKTKPKETYSYKEVYKMNPAKPGNPETSYVKHGPYFYYYESGKLKLSGQYKDGEKHGEWKYYDETGKLIRTEKYDSDSLVK